ncbi:hypothetical protein A3Q56_00654 [Intoshia linei]|uniref:RdRp catalytic domain-containing protein n=1 Tax=Intoshia linei TaxID=1819745 RepID=A0A177BBC2_9BILA|nr:hypothetical protein A3Q56_00654 [Intoshia linei]
MKNGTIIKGTILQLSYLKSNTDHSDLLMLSKELTNSLRIPFRLAWNSQLSGNKGLQQNGWSIVSLLMKEKECATRNVKVQVLALGDNQVICPTYHLPPNLIEPTRFGKVGLTPNDQVLTAANIISTISTTCLTICQTSENMLKSIILYVMYVRKSIEARRSSIKNKEIQGSLDPTFKDQSNFVQYLSYVTPFFPRFISELFQSKLYGYSDTICGLIQNSKTIKLIFSRKFPKNVYIKIINSEESSNRLTAGPTYCDDLRHMSWSKAVIGSTIPHPFEILFGNEKYVNLKKLLEKYVKNMMYEKEKVESPEFYQCNKLLLHNSQGSKEIDRLAYLQKKIVLEINNDNEFCREVIIRRLFTYTMLRNEFVINPKETIITHEYQVLYTDYVVEYCQTC